MAKFNFAFAHIEHQGTEEKCACYAQARCLEKYSQYIINNRGINNKPMVTVYPQLKTFVVSRMVFLIQTIFKNWSCILLVPFQYMSRFHIIFKAVWKSWFNIRSFYWPIEQVLWPILFKMTTSTHLVSERPRQNLYWKNQTLHRLFWFLRRIIEFDFEKTLNTGQENCTAVTFWTKEIKKTISMAENCWFTINLEI